MSKAAQGRELIAQLLDDGEWHAVSEVYSELERISIGAGVARRLGSDLGVQRKREGWPARGFWRLPVVAIIALPTSDEVRARLGDYADHATGRHGIAGVLRRLQEAEQAAQAGDEQAVDDALHVAAAEVVALIDRRRLARARRLAAVESVEVV